MPKKLIVQIQIPESQPDCCMQCPLLGIIPKAKLPKGSQETYICMPTRNAMTARYARSKVSEADKKHPRHRWCERLWPLWAQLPKRLFGLPNNVYIEERLPYEAKQQLPIIFHSNKH